MPPIAGLKKDKSFYDNKLAAMISQRNKAVERKIRQTAVQKEEYDRDFAPTAYLFRCAAKNCKGKISEIAKKFQVTRFTVEHWLKENQDIKDAYVDFMIRSQSIEIKISTEAITSSIQWRLCLNEIGFTPFEIVFQQKTRTMMRNEKLNAYLFAYPFFKEYCNAFEKRKCRNYIFNCFCDLEDKKDVRTAIVKNFEIKTGLSFNKDVIK